MSTGNPEPYSSATFPKNSHAPVPNATRPACSQVSRADLRMTAGTGARIPTPIFYAAFFFRPRLPSGTIVTFGSGAALRPSHYAPHARRRSASSMSGASSCWVRRSSVPAKYGFETAVYAAIPRWIKHIGHLCECRSKKFSSRSPSLGHSFEGSHKRNHPSRITCSRRL